MSHGAFFCNAAGENYHPVSVDTISVSKDISRGEFKFSFGPCAPVLTFVARDWSEPKSAIQPCRAGPRREIDPRFFTPIVIPAKAGIGLSSRDNAQL